MRATTFKLGRLVGKLAAGALFAGAAYISLGGSAEAKADKFGALAFSDSTGKYGWAADRASREEAEDAAIGFCEVKDCRPIVWFKNSCGAIARGDDRVVYYAYGQTSREESERVAIDRCQEHTTKCVGIAWGCTSR
ncbi:MAG: DUF4189 domain-containing protein [Polyangiaceae bacterium]